jgi:hypothetical protein
LAGKNPAVEPAHRIDLEEAIDDAPNDETDRIHMGCDQQSRARFTTGAV